MTGKTNKYVYFSRLINKEDGSTNEKEASKIRKLLALNYYDAIERKADNETICGILELGLESYGKLVDDTNGINNYADKVLELLPNNHTGNHKNWTSSLSLEKVSSMLEPLPCASKNLDSWEKLKCCHAGPTQSDIEIFVESRRNFSRRPNSVAARPVLNVRNSSAEIKPSETFSEPKKAFLPKFSVPRKPERDIGNSWGTKKDPIEEPVPSVTVSRKPEREFGNNWESKKEQIVEPAKKGSSFKTASEELRIQNVKKYGRDTGRNDGVHNYGAVKKSLGARKGASVYGKFQPPVLRNESDERVEDRKAVYSEEGKSEVDERLKNIDPKMIELIRNEIMDSGPKLSWDDIAGLEFAKNTIQEIVVWPMLRPDIFTGLRRPPKGILLFGPPGTGKTLIGKCIASQSGATFLSISASSLTSKWVGDGEKMVRALFAVARVYQPSVVFIDEIDSLLSQRSDSEHESSRRIKTEFLVQLDGVGTGEEDRLLIIGATNRPQELDEAARRRLVKRLYIPLPDLGARAQMVKNLIANEHHTLAEADVNEIAQLTEGYSGADVKHVCQEASLGPIRSIPPSQICAITSSQVRPVNLSDFKSALVRVKSTVSPDDLHSYLAWDRQFGCGSI